MKQILFSTPMVQAILAGRKTQTRRTLKFQMINGVPHNDFKLCGSIYDPAENEVKSGSAQDFESNDGEWMNFAYTNIAEGDILWVRETYLYCVDDSFLEGMDSRYVYKASIHPDWYKALREHDKSYKWIPSIHMPKAVARIFLKVKSVKVEGLHDISHVDAVAECLHREWDGQHFWYSNYKKPNEMTTSSIFSYATLWESINGTGSWDANPWVWVYEFERIEKPNN